MRAAQIGNTWAFKLAVPSNNTKAERFFFFPKHCRCLHADLDYWCPSTRRWLKKQWCSEVHRWHIKLLRGTSPVLHTVCLEWPCGSGNGSSRPQSQTNSIHICWWLSWHPLPPVNSHSNAEFLHSASPPPPSPTLLSCCSCLLCFVASSLTLHVLYATRVHFTLRQSLKKWRIYIKMSVTAVNSTLLL